MGKKRLRTKYQSQTAALKRRKFHGNQFTNRLEGDDSVVPNDNVNNLASSPGIEEPDGLKSSSAKKLKLDTSKYDNSCDQFDYNIIINFGILKDIFRCVGRCSECGGYLTLQHDHQNKQGFAYGLSLRCDSCQWVKIFFTSSIVEKENSRRGAFDINIRTVMAFREFGKGHQSIETFTSMMNFPPPLSKSQYIRINSKLHTVYTETALQTCKVAASETKVKHGGDTSNENVTDCQVSLDGTWQKRGHISLNGVVTTIVRGNGKCIDFEVMSKKCKSCEAWAKKKDLPGYDAWKVNHECQINHSKSAGAMESAGAVKMFHRSVERYGLRYTSYIGDGDSSSFSEVQKSKPYGDGVTIEKKECVGHVQKRMGTRCRTLRQVKKSVILSDGKKISGRGRLTDKAVNTLQNHYGMAIRQNIHNIYNMKKSIIAILHHSSDIQDEETRHRFCPRVHPSWCKWWVDKLEGTNNYKQNIGLPLAIKEELEPIFIDLSSEKLLSKCLHGQTQNENECLNGVIWKKCPKNVFVSRKVLEIGTSSAVIEFNDGSIGLLDLFTKLGLNPGRFAVEGLTHKDRKRVTASCHKTSDKVKKRRKKLRSIRKGFVDRE